MTSLNDEKTEYQMEFSGLTAFVKSMCSTRAAVRALPPITWVCASTARVATADLRFSRLPTWTTTRNGRSANCSNLVTHVLQQSQQISAYAKQGHQKTQMDQLNLQIQQFANEGRNLTFLPGNVFCAYQQLETTGQAPQSATGAIAATQAGNQINMLVGQEMMKLNAQTAAINQAVLEEQTRQMSGDHLTQRNMENAYSSDKAFQKSSQLVAKLVGEWS